MNEYEVITSPVRLKPESKFILILMVCDTSFNISADFSSGDVVKKFGIAQSTIRSSCLDLEKNRVIRKSETVTTSTGHVAQTYRLIPLALKSAKLYKTAYDRYIKDKSIKQNWFASVISTASNKGNRGYPILTIAHRLMLLTFIVKSDPFGITFNLSRSDICQIMNISIERYRTLFGKLSNLGFVQTYANGSRQGAIFRGSKQIVGLKSFDRIFAYRELSSSPSKHLTIFMTLQNEVAKNYNLIFNEDQSLRQAPQDEIHQEVTQGQYIQESVISNNVNVCYLDDYRKQILLLNKYDLLFLSSYAHLYASLITHETLSSGDRNAVKCFKESFEQCIKKRFTNVAYYWAEVEVMAHEIRNYVLKTLKYNQINIDTDSFYISIVPKLSITIGSYDVSIFVKGIQKAN
jgi:hypothetical protein